jgi:UDP-3-O-[3-hydroxymyristoyl] glucosamine N-acyltransferase
MRLDDIATALGCELRGDPGTEIARVWPIETASRGDLSFVANPRYARFIATTNASALIVAANMKDIAIPTLRSAEPYLVFARSLHLFHAPPPRPDGVHPTAVIAATAEIGAGASIGPHAVIEERATIGRDATLGPGVTIGHGATIGDRFTAYAGATVREWVSIGSGVILHAGAVIGSDGFGYVPTAGGKLEKLLQAGTVVIGDDVEIGANATVDRATVGETRIGRGAKIDNLVQVGHGCEIGEHTVVAAQTGLAGSTRVGSWVQMGGQSGTAGHLRIGDGCRIAGRSGVTGDVDAGSVVAGFPAVAAQQWRRSAALLPRLGELFRRLRRIERVIGGGAGDPDTP